MGYVCMPGGFGTLDEFFEALTLIQTHRIYPFPLILVGKEYWDGLMHWIEATMLKEKTISKEDIDLIKLTDDPKEVLSVINAHRDWKINMIKKSMGKKKTNVSGIKKIL